jgi:hypothetical protein
VRKKRNTLPDRELEKRKKMPEEVHRAPTARKSRVEFDCAFFTSSSWAINGERFSETSENDCGS